MVADSSIPTEYDTADFVAVANELCRKLHKPQQYKVPKHVSYACAFHKARIYGLQLKPGHFKKGGVRCISKKAKKILDEVYGINEATIRQLNGDGSQLPTTKTTQENEKMSPKVAKKIADKIKAKKSEDIEDDDDLDDDDLEDDDEDDEDDDLEYVDDDDEEDEAPPVKKGPGRPKKTETPAKRGPGRPKKNPVDLDEEDDEDIPKPKASKPVAKKENAVPANVLEAIGTILNYLKS